MIYSNPGLFRTTYANVLGKQHRYAWMFEIALLFLTATYSSIIMWLVYCCAFLSSPSFPPTAVIPSNCSSDENLHVGGRLLSQYRTNVVLYRLSWSMAVRVFSTTMPSYNPRELWSILGVIPFIPSNCCHPLHPLQLLSSPSFLPTAIPFHPHSLRPTQLQVSVAAVRTGCVAAVRTGCEQDLNVVLQCIIFK